MGAPIESPLDNAIAMVMKAVAALESERDKLAELVKVTPVGFELQKGLASKALWILSARKRRAQAFGSEFNDLFGEPCYDMLLDLYVAYARAEVVTISSICAAAGVPPSTALRRLEDMIARGLVDRQSDPDDARRRIVSLLPPAVEMVENYLQNI